MEKFEQSKYYTFRIELFKYDALEPFSNKNKMNLLVWLILVKKPWKEQKKGSWCYFIHNFQ